MSIFNNKRVIHIIILWSKVFIFLLLQLQYCNMTTKETLLQKYTYRYVLAIATWRTDIRRILQRYDINYIIPIFLEVATGSYVKQPRVLTIFDNTLGTLLCNVIEVTDTKLCRPRISLCWKLTYKTLRGKVYD